MDQRNRGSLHWEHLLVALWSIVSVSSAFVVPFTNVVRSTTTATNQIVCTQLFRNGQTSSWVEFKDPETGCQVVLLGCLHGSQSSSADVEHLFPGTDVLVLELCEARFTDLRKNVLKELAAATTTPSSSTSSTEHSKQPANMEWSQYVRMVSIMSERGGWSTGLAAAVLGGMSGWQAALTGMTPGLEFRTGLRLALTNSNDSDAQHVVPCDVILADQDVSETLRRIGQLPQVSWNMLQDWIQSGSWQQTMEPEARSLHTAIFGNERLRPFQLRIMEVLVRNRAVIQDILRVSAPSIILGYLTLTLLANIVPTSPAEASDSLSLVSSGTNMMAEALANLALLILGYVTVLLPATRVILSERDDQLYKGIKAACRVASTKRGHGNGRVLSVVGLLHVNGIAERLLSNQLVNEEALF
jgi:pheromone shutdown protein TraB